MCYESLRAFMNGFGTLDVGRPGLPHLKLASQGPDGAADRIQGTIISIPDCLVGLSAVISALKRRGSVEEERLPATSP